MGKISLRLYDRKKERKVYESKYRYQIYKDTNIANLWKQQESKIHKSTNTYIKSTVHNFPSYQLTTEEHTAISYGLDHHFHCKFSSIRIHTKFVQFY